MALGGAERGLEGGVMGEVVAESEGCWGCVEGRLLGGRGQGESEVAYFDVEGGRLGQGQGLWVAAAAASRGAAKGRGKGVGGEGIVERAEGTGEGEWAVESGSHHFLTAETTKESMKDRGGELQGVDSFYLTHSPPALMRSAVELHGHRWNYARMQTASQPLLPDCCCHTCILALIRSL